MSRKRILVIGAGLAAVLAAAVLLLPLMVDVNTYRGLIESKAEEALNRDVTLGAMSLRVFPSVGIRVEDPAVEGLLRARSLTVGVRLLPLLFGGAIEIRHVGLDRPEITLTRGADGRWELASPRAAPETDPAGSGSSAGSKAFSLKSLSVAEGRVLLVASPKAGATPTSIDFGLDLTGSIDVTGTGDATAAFDGTIATDGVRLSMDGQVESSVSGTSFRFDVEQAELRIAPARALVEAAGGSWPVPEGLLRSPSLEFTGSLSGSLEAGALRKLSLDRVVLSGLELALSRDRRGTWNFQTAAPDGAGGHAAPSGAGPEISIQDLSLTGARIFLHDEAAGRGGDAAGPVDLQLHDLSLAVAELRPGSPLDLSLSATLAPSGGSLSLQGTVPASLPEQGDATSAPVDARLVLESVPVAPLSAYLATLLGVAAESGTVSMDAAVKGTYPEKVSARGGVSFDALVVRGVKEPVTAQADFDLTARQAASLVDVNRLAARVGRSSAEVRGVVDNRGGATRVDLEIPPTSIEGDDLMGLLALTSAGLPVELSAGDPVRLQAKVKGEVAPRRNLDLSGSLEFSRAGFRHPSMSQPMRDVSGKVSLRGDGFDVTGFSGTIGRSDLSGTLSVRGFDAPQVTFDIASKRADFWELMSFLRKDDAPASGGGAAPTPPGEDFLGKVAGRGSMRIAEGSFDTLEFRDLKTTLTLQHRTLRLDPVAMSLYGGTMNGSASMDMNRDPAVYTVEARAAGVDTKGLLAANLDMGDMLSGAMTGNLSITASGTSRDAVLRAARGGGRVAIASGRVGALNVLKVLSRASDLLGEKSLEELSGRLAREGTDFSSMTADLKVSGGRVSTENLRLISADLELRDDGQLDMLAGTIDIRGNIVFSDAVSRAMVEEGSRAVDYFWDTRAGRVDLPLRMSGPLAAPTPNIDWGSAGGKLARRKVEEGLRGRLGEAGLGQLIGDRGANLPARQEDRPAPNPAPAGMEPAGPPTDAGAGDLRIVIEERAFSGNLLLPDLKIKGTLRGTAISGATVAIKDENGRVLLEESLAEKVRKYYATHDRSAPASIGFRVTLDGRKAAGARGALQVAITLTGDDGRRTTSSFQVQR